VEEARVALNPHKIVQYLNKPPEEFTKADLIKFIEDNGIQMVNFRYVAGDARLKTLNLVINCKADLDRVLSTGERVDGSSLFPYIDASSSDLYVIPRYKTAFVNPFSEVPTLDILCSYYTREGTRLPSAPENIVQKAQDTLQAQTGLILEGMGELEYYIFHEKQPLYPMSAQRGYHESAPFSKMEKFRGEAIRIMAQCGLRIKYAHSEVGSICVDDVEMAQDEVELLPTPIADAADQTVIAKWILRMLAYKYGYTLTFAPKLLVGHAGSGLHVHTRLVNGGKSIMVEDGKLSDTAKKVIGGYMRMARSLTAFGNTVPTSYLRLVPHQEAPTNVCWGDRNRSVLVRVPLAWLNVEDMIKDANPQDQDGLSKFIKGQTVELRSPDGSANIHLLLAGMAVAAQYGLQSPDSLKLANDLYVDVNIFDDQHKAVQAKLPQLPASCWESADCLVKDREIYQKDGVFTPAVIDGIAEGLKKYDDKDLSERLYGKEDEIRKLVEQYLHC